jgi:hypothetical protein
MSRPKNQQFEFFWTTLTVQSLLLLMKEPFQYLQIFTLKKIAARR